MLILREKGIFNIYCIVALFKHKNTSYKKKKNGQLYFALFRKSI